jgi:hypothetical protein
MRVSGGWNAWLRQRSAPEEAGHRRGGVRRSRGVAQGAQQGFVDHELGWQSLSIPSRSSSVEGRAEDDQRVSGSQAPEQRGEEQGRVGAGEREDRARVDATAP